MFVWLAILTVTALGLVRLIGRRAGSGTRVPRRGDGTAVDVGSGALAVRDLGWSALAGVAGSLVSIAAGVFASAVSIDPDEGATFVAIWFWLAGPPVAAVAMALVVRFRAWDPPAVGVHAVVAFSACVLCGLVALEVSRPRSSSPPPVDSPQTTNLDPATTGMTPSTVG